MDLETLLKQYDYKISPRRIAQKPASPRDSARLLVYRQKTKSLSFDTFKNIGKYLPPNALLVFNQTKVVPARFNSVAKVKAIFWLLKKLNNFIILNQTFQQIK